MIYLFALLLITYIVTIGYVVTTIDRILDTDIAMADYNWVRNNMNTMVQSVLKLVVVVPVVMMVSFAVIKGSSLIGV